MEKSVQRLLIGLFVILTLTLSACGGDDGSGGGSSKEPDIVPVGDIQSDGFWIALVPDDNWNYLTHKSTGIADDCFIDEGTLLNEDIDCEIHVPEGNVYAQDFQLQINVPPKMCRYLNVGNYWYYNHEVGYGATQVIIDEQGAPDCTVVDERGTTGPASCLAVAFDEISFKINGTSADPVCQYDYKDAAGNTINCCLGNYTLTKIDAIGESTVTDEVWNDELSRGCLGGSGGMSAADDEWPRDLSGFPINRIDTTWVNGFNEAIELFGTMNNLLSLSNNVMQANFYDPADHAGIKPLAMIPGADTSGTLRADSQDRFEFRCMDEGFETIQRIELDIIEWNTESEFLTYVSTGLGDPDVVGLEDNVSCEYSSDPNGVCNDTNDWKDVGDAYPQDIFQ